MARDRLLLDTAFVQALLNRKDEYHEQAKAILPRVRAAAEVWVTEAVLVEVGNALSAFDREGAARFIDQCYRTPNIRTVGVDTALLMNKAASAPRSSPDLTQQPHPLDGEGSRYSPARSWHNAAFADRTASAGFEIDQDEHRFLKPSSHFSDP
jgi:hypothetical protein